MGMEGTHPLDNILKNVAMYIACGGLAGSLCGIGISFLMRF